MIKELEKQGAIYIWNNHYQGTFTPIVFDELLKTNELIKNDTWNKEIAEIKTGINTDLFQSFVAKYRGSKINHPVENLEIFIKDDKQYLKLNLCLNSGFMACFLLDLDYTVKYLCIDSKIEIATLTYVELNQVYNKHKELIPPPLEFIEEFNRMNDELSELTGKNVDRTMYQVWFKLVPNIKLDATFAKSYNAYQSVGEVLFGDVKVDDKGGEVEYVAVV